MIKRKEIAQIKGSGIAKIKTGGSIRRKGGGSVKTKRSGREEWRAKRRARKRAKTREINIVTAFLGCLITNYLFFCCLFFYFLLQALLFFSKLPIILPDILYFILIIFVCNYSIINFNMDSLVQTALCYKF